MLGLAGIVSSIMCKFDFLPSKELADNGLSGCMMVVGAGA